MTNVVRLIDREVIKHSAAIQVQGSVGILSRRIWNVMLANAYDHLPTQDEHTIKIKDLSDALEFDSNDHDVLRASMRELVSATVEWNTLGKDKESAWGLASLLAHVEFERGIAKYSYSPFLRRMLHNPRMYAKIKLSLQNAFRSKYSLVLFELMHDYFDGSRQEGETPWISVERFRELMGVDESQYPAFKALNQWVIRIAVDEVSTKTDIEVKVHFQRNGRQIAALKFTSVPRTGKKVKTKNPVPPDFKKNQADPKGRKLDPRSGEYRGPVDHGIGIGW